jgi:hypothetical protein
VELWPLSELNWANLALSEIHGGVGIFVSLGLAVLVFLSLRATKMPYLAVRTTILKAA